MLTVLSTVATGLKTELRVVSFFGFRKTDNNGVTRDKPFGQNQQAMFTTEALSQTLII